MRAACTRHSAARRAAVASGFVDTMNSAVVGEGRRIVRRGAVVSMVVGVGGKEPGSVRFEGAFDSTARGRAGDDATDGQDGDGRVVFKRRRQR